MRTRFLQHYRAIFLCCILSIFVAGMFLWGSSFLSFFSDKVGQFWGLSLKECLIEGRGQTPIDDIWGAIRCPWGQNIFSCSLKRMHEDLRKLPWVKDVVIIRRLPSTIIICLKEKKPMAVWQHQGKKVVISEEGEVISGAPLSEEYLVVTGKDAPMHTWHLLKSLESYKKKLPKVSAATFLRSQRWDIYLEDKTCVKLSEKNIEESLRRLLRVLKWRAEKKKSITMIDLRFIDAIIIDMPSAASEKSVKKNDVPSRSLMRNKVRLSARAA